MPDLAPTATVRQYFSRPRRTIHPSVAGIFFSFPVPDAKWPLTTMVWSNTVGP